MGTDDPTPKGGDCFQKDLGGDLTFGVGRTNNRLCPSSTVGPLILSSTTAHRAEVCPEPLAGGLANLGSTKLAMLAWMLASKVPEKVADTELVVTMLTLPIEKDLVVGKSLTALGHREVGFPPVVA